MTVARAMGSRERRIRGREPGDGAEGRGGALRWLGPLVLAGVLLLGGAGGAAAETALVVVVCTGPSTAAVATLTQNSNPIGDFPCDSSDPTTRAVQYEVSGIGNPDGAPISVGLTIPGCGSTECGAERLITRNGGAVRFFSSADQKGITVVVAIGDPGL